MVESRSYSSGATDKPLLNVTIGSLFDDIAMRLPEHEALISRHEDLRLTYAQLRARVDELALAFIGFGVKKGDRVGIWSPNNYAWVATQFATAKMGAILVNINPAYRVQELEYALKQSEVSFLITAKQFKSSDYHSMIYELVPELRQGGDGVGFSSSRVPTLRKVVTLDDRANPGMVPWNDFIKTGRAGVDPSELIQRANELDCRDPINIQYTSGTTGFPKGATLTHYGILNNGFFVGEGMRFTEKDRLCIPVPFYHCFGMVLGNLACVTHGATMVLPSDSFSAESVLATVEEEKCTALHGVPTMFIAELEHPRLDSFNLSSLRTGIMAGSPCPIEVIRKVISQMGMREITIGYGMTETSPVSFQTSIDDPIELRVSTVGKVHPHVEAKVIDQLTGSVVPHGNSGELCVRGYLVMKEYWNNPNATREAIDNEQWMHTGDLAIMNTEGYVNIVGRTKDMISRGGEKIFPKEVEDFLYTHPKISDVQVIGVPSTRYGEEVMAWVKLKPGTMATADELREYCKGKIAYFKVPAYFRFTDTFPMTITGKIQKFKMREISTKELGLQDAATIKTA
ncbi:MAG: AMP-binding protein [Candidatus Bathyarchaeia archaeon]